MPGFTKKQIDEISQQLDCGNCAYYHKETGELIFVPDLNQFQDMDLSGWRDELRKLKKDPLAYEEIYAMESSDSFRVMEDFAEQVDNKKLQKSLYYALNHKKPFSHFKFVIDYSGDYRQQWFDFKNHRYLAWVENQLKLKNVIEGLENEDK